MFVKHLMFVAPSCHERLIEVPDNSTSCVDEEYGVLIEAKSLDKITTRNGVMSMYSFRKDARSFFLSKIKAILSQKQSEYSLKACALEEQIRSINNEIIDATKKEK